MSTIRYILASIDHNQAKDCLPNVVFPNDLHITFAHNHCVNETTVKDYIIVPYILRKKNRELKCIIDSFSFHPIALVNFNSQCTLE